MNPEDVELEYRDDDDVKTPRVERRCFRCGGGFQILPDAAVYPESLAEAWTPTDKGPDGRPVVRCRGTADPALWAWCKVSGELDRMDRTIVVFFRDRRTHPREVETERRRPPPTPKDAGKP